MTCNIRKLFETWKSVGIERNTRARRQHCCAGFRQTLRKARPWNEKVLWKPLTMNAIAIMNTKASKSNSAVVGTPALYETFETVLLDRRIRHHEPLSALTRSFHQRLSAHGNITRHGSAASGRRDRCGIGIIIARMIQQSRIHLRSD